MRKKSAFPRLPLAAIISFLAMLPAIGNAQFGVGYHQSNLSFVSFNYEIKGRFKPELRVNTNLFDEDLSVEAVALFDILNKEDYEFYAGIGVRSSVDEGVVFPVGLNIYPLPFKNFGFHIELAPIINDFGILRGSWGIRYRFLRSAK